MKFPLLLLLLVSLVAPAMAAPSTTVTDYESIQEALDKNPGRMLYVPAGDYVITKALEIKTANSGLWGPGRIVQASPDQEVVKITGAANVQIRDVTLTRADGKQESNKSALLANRASGVVIANIQVLDNWANANAISVVESPRCVVRDSLVQNYSRIAIDDRTRTSFLGYAFKCIDGTGLSVNGCVGAMIVNNRIVENRMLPTKELKDKYELGKFTKKNQEKGWNVTQEMWDAEYFNGWHQGSALVVNSGETGDCIQIIGNYIENAAQGVDIHGDHVIMANNVINGAFIGMKAIHGSRNVIVLGNQFSKSDLWAIGIMPGTASHEAGVSVELSGGRKSGIAANIDGYSIVANNIVSDFGYGLAHWNWPVDLPNVAPMRFGSNGFAKAGKPSVRDVIVQGNIVYDTGRDKVVVDGKPQVEVPRYNHAVLLGEGDDAPRNVIFSENIFHPGLKGVSNGRLTP